MNNPQPIQSTHSSRRTETDWGRRATIVLRASRQEIGLSQQAVAEKCGWTRNMVANIESGRARVRFQDFMAIAAAIEIDPQDLLRRIVEW
jgi:transcriptional regulator with XRE-family HTH domain